MLLRGRTAHLSGDDGSLATGLVAHGATIASEGHDVDLVVHVVRDPGDLAEEPLADTTLDTWSSRCDGVITTAVDAAQDAHRRLAGRGGRLVFVVPTLGLTGAAGLVPFATAVEGIRALAKTAARQWGKDGITVACVAHHQAGPTVALSSLEPPTDDDLAGVVALVASEHASPLTGATVVVDAGTVLVP